MELDTEQREPTVLQYARFHGLCKDYTSVPLLSHIDTASQDPLVAALGDLPDLPALNNPAERLLKERLELSKDAALLLKLVHSVQQGLEDLPQIIDIITEERTRVLKLKQEVPILRSDNELDLLNFGSTAIPNINSLKIPLEPISVENDEGLQWPSNYLNYPENVAGLIRAERLAVSKDDMRFLQNAVKDNFTQEDAARIEKDAFNYEKNPALRPITPPLLPLTPPSTPYIPSSPGNQLKLLSESSGPSTDELKALESAAMKADAILPNSDYERFITSIFDPPSLNDGHFNIDSLSERTHQIDSRSLKRTAHDLRVEGPLTPPLLSNSPMKRLKSVSFPEMLNEYIPELPSKFESGDDLIHSDDSFSAFFKPHADEAKRLLDNERLSDVDTMKRVDVPSVDFSLPIAPWHEFSYFERGGRQTDVANLNTQKEFLVRIKQSDFSSDRKWHGISKLERLLTWTPFPLKDSAFNVVESLHDEDALSKLVMEPSPSEIATSSTDMWKRDGLRVLEEEDEDEIERWIFEDRNDMGSLVKKRKAELEEESEQRRSDEIQWKTKPNAKRPQPTSKLSNTCDPTPEPRPEVSPNQGVNAFPERDSSLMFGGMFNISTAHRNFMRQRTICGAPTTSNDSNKTSFAARHHRPGTIAPSTKLAKPTDLHTEEECTTQMPSPLKETPPDLPPIPKELHPCSFIVSSIFLQQRSLMRNVEKMYADANFIERDFNSPFSPSTEAEILLSPSTGLMFTQLQQLKQRSLPGQPERSPVKERISALQSRYERLIVLVSEGLRRDAEVKGSSRPIDKRDQEAIADLERFTSKLEATILVKYIRGGELALSRQIVIEMSTLGLPSGSKDIGDIKVLQDETTWELFLRRCGLNPYASQVILSSLKTAVSIPTPSRDSFTTSSPQEGCISVYGLQSFIAMTDAGRKRKFQALLGGSRILGRVSAVLDQQWPSAANEFQV